MPTATTTRRTSMGHRQRRGFTIIELVVVLAIIALLAGGATVGLMTVLGDARVKTTTNDMRTVGSAIKTHMVENAGPPSTLQELVVSGLLETPSSINDAWDRPLQYRANTEYRGTQVAWLIISLGENGLYDGGPGIGDDIFLAAGFDPE